MRRPPSRLLARRDSGFTIAELLLALTLSTVVALLVGMMLAALESTTRAESDTRRASVQRQLASIRLGSLIRSSAGMLALDGDAIVLWTGDATNDNAINLSELRVVELKPATQEVWTYAAPPNLDSAENISYALEADFLSIVENLITTAQLQGEVTVRSVTEWTVTADQPTPRDAALLSITITMQTDNGSLPTTLVAAFRATTSLRAI